MDTYVRRTTRAFAFLWSFYALGTVVVAVLLGAFTEPAPDFFIVAFAALSGFGGAVIGFFHGVTLSAARRFDAAVESASESDVEESETYGG